MKKSLIIFVLFIALLGLTGCGNGNEDETSVAIATLDDNGNIILNEEEITSSATFLNYEVDNVQIGFVVVRGTDGNVRIALNTCQVCNPSPNAYFIQVGEYLECQNCGNRFHIDKVGILRGGCNPAPVDEMTQEDGVITISGEYARTYIDNFKNWNGPKA